MKKKNEIVKNVQERICEPPYGRIVNWVDDCYYTNTAERIDFLKSSYGKDIIDAAVAKISENGWLSSAAEENDTQKLMPLGHTAYSGVTPAFSFAFDDNDDHICVPALIVNTVDSGFRFVAPGENGGTVDLGPVDSACIVGNAERPSALLIPLNSVQGLLDGTRVAINYSKMAIRKCEAEGEIEIDYDDENNVNW